MSYFSATPNQKGFIRNNSLHFTSNSNKKGKNNPQEPLEATDAAPTLTGEDHIDVKAVHITSNIWPKKGIGKELRKQASRSYLHGVEIQTLSAPHVLSGQTGLFAVNPFSQFDIIGEYCGEVHSGGSYTPPHGDGEYCAYLEDWRQEVYPLGLDAQTFGNECRAINHYANIAGKANVIMKTCYVEQLPRIIIVCKRDITIGEELLLDYGSGYVEKHFS